MKRVGFITDDIEIQEPLSRIFDEFGSVEEFSVETLNRLNPELPTTNKIRSLFEICDVIVFYISKGSPNIYYEIGLAKGSKKNIVIIAESHRQIPFDLANQKSVITEGRNFKHVAYEVYCAIDVEAKLGFSPNSSNNEAKLLFESHFNNYAPQLQYRDLYAFNGPKRHILFEQWFSDLAKNVNHWRLIESEGKLSRDSFDFMLWNSTEDPELQSLGNPIPVELKALNSMNSSQWNQLAEKLRKQGLRSLLLLTTAKNRRNAASFSKKLKDEHGILIVSLDRDDLIEIETPKDLYFAIKKQLLNIMYRGG